MAANVATWDDIRNNASYGSAEQTLNLQNDIDLNNEYPYGVSTVTIGLGIGFWSNSGTWTLDGDDGLGGRYKIRNLRTLIATPQSIFNMYNRNNPNVKVIFKNIDFVNLILSGADFFTNGDFTGSIEFINCRFVGCRTGNTYLINKKTRITCTSCYFDMPWYGANSDVYTYTSLIPALADTEVQSLTVSSLPTAYYCWFHETYGGWTVATGFGSSTTTWTGSPDGLIVTSCQCFCMHGCYMDGKVYAPWSSLSVISSFLYVYRYNLTMLDWTPTVPNVVDINWVVTRTGNTVANCFRSVFSCVFKEKVTKTDGTDWTLGSTAFDTSKISSPATGSSMPNPITATPEQMEDAAWLQSQGFPIIVPSTT